MTNLKDKIREVLPKKKEFFAYGRIDHTNGYNQALSQISSDEVLDKIIGVVKEDMDLDMQHEQAKLLGGFSHPKDCERCNQNKE